MLACQWLLKERKDHSSRLLQPLLTLAKVNLTTPGELRAERLDLAELAAATFDRFQILALETGHELAFEAETAPTYADPRLLEQALNNLVANALRHTSPGQITITSGVTEGGAFLEVADMGPGLPDVVREGLGLRVIKSVAEAHNCVLTFGHAQDSRVRLQFPSPA